MGSEFGYEYAYTFSMVDEDEITPTKYTPEEYYKPVEYQDDGSKTFLFDIRTNFQFLLRDGDQPLLIDSERFDISVGESMCRPERFAGKSLTPEFISALPLLSDTGFRLGDYWMNSPEILSFCGAALDFAKQMAAHPQSASLRIIPVVVSFQVCTVQREGESYEATMDRAICSKRLLPLYLWGYPTTTARKPVCRYAKNYLTLMCRDRNKFRLGPHWVCHFCSKRHCVEAQITRLKCDHTYHSHCIARWLEDDKACPICRREHYL